MEQSPKNPIDQLRSSIINRGSRLEVALSGKIERVEYSASAADIALLEDLRMRVTETYHLGSLSSDAEELERFSNELSELEAEAQKVLDT